MGSEPLALVNDDELDAQDPNALVEALIWFRHENDELVRPAMISEWAVIRDERDALLVERDWLRSLVDRLSAPTTQGVNDGK